MTFSRSSQALEQTSGDGDSTQINKQSTFYNAVLKLKGILHIASIRLGRYRVESMRLLIAFLVCIITMKKEDI